MKKNQLILGLVVLVRLAALVFWGRTRIHFDFERLSLSIRARLTGALIAASAGCIYLAYVFRSARWARLTEHNKKVGPFSLLGTQVIGFTGSGPHRPCRRSGSTLSGREKNRPSPQLSTRRVHR